MKHIRRWAAALVALALAVPAVAAQPQARGPADVDGARIRAADREPQNWMAVGRSWDETHYSPLTGIKASNVARLGLAWSADMDTYRGAEASPIEVDGTLYNVTPWNVATAYDARTGNVLWTYDPKTLREFGRKACCDIVSRGLSVWKGKVLIATLDGRLIAIDAKSGQPVWSVDTFAGEPPWPYTITGAPRVFDGKVLIGNGGAELGVRGYVTAYDAETGKKLWRFYTVPGDPAKGPDKAASDEAMAMAAKTWTGEWWKYGGGGTAWDAITYDPKLKLIYIGVGNGSPWVHKWRSPGGGDNLFLASIVAVKADTGKYVWHYQETPGEQFDSTATQPMILADLTIKGRLRHVLMQAPKNGFFYVLDRATGKLISAEPFVPINWATKVDMKTGRPVETPLARYGTTPVLMSPGPGGGHNYNPMAYSPKTGLVYFPVVESYFTLAAAPAWTPAQGGLGTAFTGADELRKEQAAYANAHTKAWLAAWDPVKGKTVWKVPYPHDGSGGVLATASGLVFEGTIGKTLAAYDAKTGKKLWESDTQTVPVAAPITYAIDGVQYLAVNAGWGGGLAHVQANSFKDLQVSPARLLVYKLGGTAKLPPMPPGQSAPPPAPPVRAPEAVVQKGAALFAQNCALCHGQLARGGIKDLRLMSADTHAAFDDIVLGGARKAQGMASFADALSKDDAAAVHAYLNARISEDWGEMSLGKR
ncbi:MAG: PQQ-dependent dehydrogenase, methanol/ethanol family [Caulobacteraceae bacterium]